MSLSAFLVQPPPQASFLGIPLELRDHIYDLVAAQSELIARSLDQKEVTLVIGWAPLLLACKQVYRECCTRTRMIETLRWESNKLDSWMWGQNNIQADLSGILGPLCGGVRILKTLLKPDEADLWDIVSCLPALKQVHVALPEENTEFDLSLRSHRPSIEKWLKDLVDPYFRRPTVVGWQPMGVGWQPMGVGWQPGGLMNSLMTYAMSSSPWAPGSRRQRLTERSQQILDQQLERGVKFVVHVRLYASSSLPRQASIKDNKKLRQEWNVTLDGATGELISKKKGQLCWGQLSGEEAWLEGLMEGRSGFVDTLSISAPAEDEILQRYTNLTERKPGKGKGKGKGHSQTERGSKGRLTYSKDRNLQALML